ncbi:MAG: hypothetical protein ABI600_06775 [Luteolibacter sp.]
MASPTNPNPNPNPLAALTAAIRLHKIFADKARAELIDATPILVAAIRHRSGQSRKIEIILWSCWNGENKVGLCDTLSGLDAPLAQALIAIIAARTFLGGDADDLLHRIIAESGSQPPTSPAN